MTSAAPPPEHGSTADAVGLQDPSSPDAPRDGVGWETTPDVRRRVTILLALGLAAYWPTLLSFPQTWSASYQEHGFFLGGLAVWVAWTQRDRFFRECSGSVMDLTAMVGLLSLGWLCAAIMGVRSGHQLAFVAVGTLWALTLFGWGARVPILTVASILALAVPVWGFLIPILQRMTVIASGAATRLAGIQAEIGYDTIAITSGTFLVEEGCSGINYLMGGLTLGAFYAQLFTRRWQTQLKIVALAAAMSILGNWIRVTVLIFLGEATAMQSPYIEDHLWQGWAIFTLLMVPTYFGARRIEERDAPKEAAEAAEFRPPGRPVSAGVANAATVAAVVGPVLFMLVGALPRSGDVDRNPEVFTIHDAWSGAMEAGVGGWTPDFHGIDESARWTVSVSGVPVELARHYFRDQRQGEELIQWNNAVAPDSLTVAEGKAGPIGPRRRIVGEAIVLDDGSPRLTWYWYRVAGFDTPFETKAKLLEILSFFRRSPAAELVTMSAACAPDSCSEAHRTLRMAVMGPDVPDLPDPRGGGGN